MYLEKMKIQNFRNYEKQEINLSNKINIFYGDNAQGKTNIIESIFLMAFGKSFRTNKDKEMIMLKKDFTKINGIYEKKDRQEEIEILINNKKIVSHNGIKLKKLSELVGNLNIVIFTPEDINILKGGPSERRKFIDMMIGQVKPRYLYNLAMYNKTLEQRNSFLKNKIENDIMLDIWDEKLYEYGKIVNEYRKKYIEKISKKIQYVHDTITNEKIEIKYISECNNKDEFMKNLKIKRKIDKIRGYTSIGIHRDDFKIYIDKKEVNVYGSQGQNRTVVLSLKLTEIEIIKEEIGEYPILLLDDFMSELDEKRITKFLSNIKNIQVIITCTKNIKIDNSKSFKIEQGNIIA